MVTIARAAPEHIPSMVALLAEMDRFYGTTDLEPADTRAEQVKQALFSDVPAGYSLLAWNTDRLVGIASYSFLWPAIGLSRSLFLKELYVASSHRRMGIGSSLMQAVFDTAAEHGCTRVEWTTDDTNANAQHFYADLGAPREDSKIFYRKNM